MLPDAIDDASAVRECGTIREDRMNSKRATRAKALWDTLHQGDKAKARAMLQDIRSASLGPDEPGQSQVVENLVKRIRRLL